MKVEISALEVKSIEGDVLKLKLEYFVENKPDEDVISLKISDPQFMYASLILELDKVVSKRIGVKLKRLHQNKVVGFFKQVIGNYEEGKVLGRIEFTPD